MSKTKFTVKPKKEKRKITAFEVICATVLTIYCLLLFFMIAWSIINSAKFTWDFDDDPMGIPPKWYWKENYEFVFKNFIVRRPSVKAMIGDMFLNSAIYAIGCALASTIVSAITAYVTARFKWKFSGVIYGAVIFTMVFPIIGSAPSEMQFVTKLGFKNHFYGMFILKANFIGMYFLILYATFNGLSNTYAEAAKIDGANNYTIMFRIYFPMVIPTFFTIWLLYFVNYWNDYQTVLLYAPDKPTIAYGLYYFNSNGGYDTPYKLGACLLVFIPIFIIFLIFRERLMGRLSLDGGVKG